MNLKNVMVKFPNSAKVYSFRTDLDAKVGDVVVCDTVQGYCIAEVKEVNTDLSMAKKWIVDIVDKQNHLRRLQEEKKKVDIFFEKKRLHTEMETRMCDMIEENNMNVFKIIATHDSTMLQLVRKYQLL
jgi:hypothetical protein